MSGDLALGHLVAFNAALLLAILSPGPALLFLTRQTLRLGRRAGLLTACGLAVMASLWTLAALLGLQTLFVLFPFAYLTLKAAGALYLIWLALRMWRDAARPLDPAVLTDRRGSAFVGGVLINLANPKSVFFSAAVLVVIFPATLGPLDKGLIFANHLAVELLVQPALALLLSTAAVRQRYLTFKPTLDRAAGALLGFLGLRLLQEIRS